MRSDLARSDTELPGTSGVMTRQPDAEPVPGMEVRTTGVSDSNSLWYIEPLPSCPRPRRPKNIASLLLEVIKTLLKSDLSGTSDTCIPLIGPSVLYTILRYFSSRLLVADSIYVSYTVPSGAPISISRVEDVGCAGFQATASIVTFFKRERSFGCRDCV